MESELENIAQQVPAEQCQCGGVQCHYRQVRKPQEPRAYERVVPAEGVSCKCEFTSRLRVGVDHIVVIERYYGHYKGGKSHAYRSAERACGEQEFVARHHECAPSYDATEGEGPYIHRREISLQLSGAFALVVFGFCCH